MSIKVQLQEDMKQAMKAKDKATLGTIRMIIDVIQKKEKEMLRDATNDEQLAAVQTFRKQTQESIEGYGKANNGAKVLELTASLQVANRYLPSQLSREDIMAIVMDLGNGVRNKGELMKLVMPQLKGKADNKVISEVVDQFLS